MPYLYVYSSSDFVVAPPEEQGAMAAGTSDFKLTLADGATPTRIEITDNDLIFDEIDSSQVLTEAVNLDGVQYAAGTTIQSAYDLINSDTGHQVTSLHFGGNGYQQGAVDGLVSSIPLESGTTYSFDQERTSHRQANAYDNFAACFTATSRIQTDRGYLKAQDLVAGDMIQTMDHGLQPLRQVLVQHLTERDLARAQHLRPVRISAGALGIGLPKRDLLVSPQHRFLARSRIVKRMFGQTEALITAIKLTALPGIYIDHACPAVDYFHLIMDRHEIIFAEGAPTESFFLGPVAQQVLPPKMRAEIETVFGGATSPWPSDAKARPVPDGKRQRRLVSRHVKNSRPIFDLEVR